MHFHLFTIYRKISLLVLIGPSLWNQLLVRYKELFQYLSVTFEIGQGDNVN